MARNPDKLDIRRACQIFYPCFSPATSYEKLAKLLLSLQVRQIEERYVRNSSTWNGCP